MFSLFSYAYVSLQSIDRTNLPLLQLNGILSTYSVNALSSLLLHLCCDFNIDLLPFKIYL